MNAKEALDFLRRNQPLPPTSMLSEETLKYYREIIEYLKSNPIQESVPLLLNSFGEGDGHGIFSMVEGAIVKHPKEIVIPYLLQSLTGNISSVKSWCAELSMLFYDPIFFGPLRELFLHGNEDQRASSFYALKFLDTPEAREVIAGYDDE